jgi:RimJ/RimL family protein N-acetyltransferase
MNTKPFDNFRIIDCGSILLSGISENLMLEAVGLVLSTSNQEAKKYLERCPSNLKEANNEISKMVFSFHNKTSLTFTIKLKTGGTIGFIIVHAPNNSTDIKDWLLEYHLSDTYLGKGIMTVCLRNVLAFLKNNQVQSVKAVVDYENFPSKRILEKFGFEYYTENQLLGKEVYELILNDL